jgi:PAS domain S-box-containing protein
MVIKSNSPLRILFVEDLESDQMLAELEIRKHGIEFVSKRVDYEELFRKELNEFIPDIIISDFAMPLFDGMSALNIALEIAPQIPFIILTGSMNEEVAVECMKAGADDYILKENLKRLAPAIKAAIIKKESLTARIKAEESLRKSEEQFRSLFENHYAVHLLIDPETQRIVNANIAASRFYGWSVEELKSMKINQINTLSKEDIDVAFQSVLSKNNQQFEFRHRRADGSIRDVEIFSSKIEINGKDHIYHIVHDITERKHLFEEIVLAKEKAEESDRLKSAFLANMSHEIRTPLNGILGFTSILTNEENLPKSKRIEYSKIINQCTDNLLHIINDILDLSKLETGQLVMSFKPFNLNESLKRLHTIYLKKLTEIDKEHLRFYLLLPERKVIINTDEHRLIQVFMNLLDNAIKFTEQGSISYGISEVSQNFVTFIVSDTGVGIAKEKHTYIFERFYQADELVPLNYGGSGLGLSIVKKLVELMNGQISFESEFGAGTTFQFKIPYKEGQVLDVKSNEVEVIGPLKVRRNLLVVEDDIASQQYYNEILSKLNIDFYIATTGKEALHRVNVKMPDIILMDIRLPDANGLDVVREIRKLDANVLIIAQTAYASPTDETKALEAGCNSFLSKPVGVSNLLEILS